MYDLKLRMRQAIQISNKALVLLTAEFEIDFVA